MPEIAYIDVVAAILWRDDRFLAVERPQGKELAGFWEFPGGKVEPGESLEEALARELDEELGLAPHGMDLCHTTEHTYPHKAVRLYFFRIRAFDGRPTPHEGHRLRWLTPAEALELPFLPADQDLVAELADAARRAAEQGGRRGRAGRTHRRTSVRIDRLIAARKPFVSLEFFPPKDRGVWGAFFETVDKLKAIDPLFCSVTYGAGGSTHEHTLDIATTMAREMALEPLVHLTTVGASRNTIGAFLDSLAEAGIGNVLALRGDPPKGQCEFVPDNEEFQHASDLVRFIRERQPEMGVAVAGYPEAHPTSTSIAEDLRWTKYKVEQGAQAIITQLFFDPRIYFDFVARMREMGVDVPVVPGVLPILSRNSARFILGLCGARIPGSLYLEIEEAHERGGNKAVREVGIAFAVRQARALLAGGAPGVHLYTLNQASACLEIFGQLEADFNLRGEDA